jgi:hypothetical protein
LSSIQMFYNKYIRFWNLMLCSTFWTCYWSLIGGEISYFNLKWNNFISNNYENQSIKLWVSEWGQ